MIREFFVNENPKFLFKPFGLIHNIFTITTIVFLIIIYFNRNRISKMDKTIANKFLIISSIILFLNMLIYTFGNLYYGSFNYKENLPFHLCFIANYMYMFAIIFKKPNLLRYTFFLGIIGPTAAILWPDLISTIDNYNFWQLVISHHFFINLSLFTYYKERQILTKKDMVKALILIYILIAIMLPFNLIFKTNYIFSTQIPDNVLKLYPFLKPVPPILLVVGLSTLYGYVIYKFIVVKRNIELKAVDK